MCFAITLSKHLKILSNSSSVKLDPLGKHSPFSNNLSARKLLSFYPIEEGKVKELLNAKD